MKGFSHLAHTKCSTCQCLPRAVTTRSSMGRLQAPHIGIPILSWHRKQYSSFWNIGLLYRLEDNEKDIQVCVHVPFFSSFKWFHDDFPNSKPYFPKDISIYSSYHFVGSVARSALYFPGVGSQLIATGRTVEVVGMESVATPAKGLPIDGRAGMEGRTRSFTASLLSDRDNKDEKVGQMNWYKLFMFL